MCSLRALWILKGDEFVLSRRFNIVEIKVRKWSGQSYIQIPNDVEFLSNFRSQVISSESTQPIRHAISINDLFPIIYIKRQSIYYICIPSMEDNYLSKRKPSPIESPFITGALSFLDDLVNLSSNFAPEFRLSGVAELEAILGGVIVMGKVLNSSSTSVLPIFRQSFPPPFLETEKSKRPSWKPYLYKGKPKIEFVIQEKVSGVQFDHEQVQDQLQVSGSILCKADLEGLPEVRMNLMAPTAKCEISHFSLDSCVQMPTLSSSRQNGDAIKIINGNGNSQNGNSQNGNQNGNSDPHISPEQQKLKQEMESGWSAQQVDNFIEKLKEKISFSPPVESFSLCKYSLTNFNDFPIRGFFQMKEISPKEIKVLVQLKLSSKVKNNFQYCELELNLQNRGFITHLDVTPTCGTVSVINDKKTLKWNIGHKFTGRTLELALPAIIYVEGKPDPNDDPFLINQNSFVKLRFKIIDDCLSGISVNTNSLMIDPKPSSKLQIQLTREIISTEYIIWNSLGDIRYSTDSR